MHFHSPASRSSPDLPQSLWAATAIPPPVTEPLQDSRQADVIIVGGGYTGLSTALHLAERGIQACVLEARTPGWGASGRNGGQVIPGLKHDPDTLVAMHGRERAEPLIDMIGSGADTVFGLIDRYAIPCHPVRAGWIQTAHSTRVLESLLKRAQQWQARGAKVEILDRAQVGARLGTDAFVGGWVDRRAGSIHPLSYARGLARAAQTLKAGIYGNTLVTGLERVGGQWQATTASGATVRAPHVVIGTNGYTDGLWPGLAQTVLAANSFIIATRPLQGAAASSILPGGEVASDSRRLLLYFRRDDQGRFLLGGRGPFAEPSGPEDWKHLTRSLGLLYPGLLGVPVEYRWAGRVAITRDFVPHVHEPAPGAIIALGYNGRGVAMATQLGKQIAARIAGESSFPYPLTDIKPLPLHRLRRLYIGLGVAYYGLLDMLS